MEGVVTRETDTDVNPFNIFPGNSSITQNKYEQRGNNKPKVKFDPYDLYYDMTGEKYLVVFNHFEYQADSTHYYKKPHSKRLGTEEDVKALHDTFTSLGFKVDVYNDKDFKTIFKILEDLQAKDFGSASCLCIAILTHGSNKGELCANDKPYNLNEVTKLFENHPTLAGKPKLFFIQACRGGNMDSGTQIAIDGESKKVAVTPSHSDFLVMRSTVEDYLSYRDNRGSWLIQELCKAIQKYGEECDILHIITLVHQKIAHGYVTYSLNAAKRNRVQMPETTFTLTKFLKF